ncbi:unnamed protein product, partial [Phaeothamnion confervicola]
MCRPSSAALPNPGLFPWGSMVAMSLALLANGIALTSLFAYVGFMVTDLGISPDTNAAGFTAGYISGAFMIGRLFSSFFWGSFSDHVGRKPVLYLSLAAIVIFSVLFGCSTTFAMALSSRLLIGFFNAIVGTCRTAISEICGPYYEVRGMGFLMGSWSVSFVIGPAIGGLLARPAVQYPGAFGTGGLFGRFPYLLPNLVAAAVAAVALPCVYFVMPETSGSTESSEPPSPPPPPHKTDGAWAARGERRSAGTVGDSAADGGNRNGGGRSRIRVRKSAAPPPGDGSPAPDEPSLSGCAALPHLLGGAGGRLRRALLGTYGLFSFLSIIYDEVLPLWCITSVTAGGLGWGTGQMLSISGLFLVCFQFAMFPPLARRLGVVRFMKAALALLVPLYLLFPLAGRLAGRSVSLDATVVALSIAAKSMSNVVFASHALCTNNAVETEARGSFNGLMMTAGSAAKGTAPAVGSIIYAWSVT